MEEDRSPGDGRSELQLPDGSCVTALEATRVPVTTMTEKLELGLDECGRISLVRDQWLDCARSQARLRHWTLNRLDVPAPSCTTQSLRSIVEL